MARSYTDRYGQVYYANASGSASNLNGGTTRVNGSGYLSLDGGSGAYGYSGIGGRLYINGTEKTNCIEPQSSWSGSAAGLSASSDFARQHEAYTVSVKYTYYSANSYGLAGHTIEHTVNVTIPAKASYAVKYNANGGIGEPDAQTKWYDEDLILSDAIPVRSGYKFVGWNTKADGTGTGYAIGTTYTGNAALTLYAIWKPAGTLRHKVNGEWKAGIPYIKVNGEWKQAVAYEKIDGNWKQGV